MTSSTDAPRFAYALHPLPPSRIGLRRWRWELWHAGALVAAGWRITQEHAVRALCTAASRRGHAQLGLHPLRPERAATGAAFGAGRPVRLDCGAFECLLVPRLPGAAGWTPAMAAR
ncbi:hypothetical protein FSW04_16770 [Baekduia soli]|uniref:Uncharacterized protein n=1 Tax=Baekduia soli TaxID=496014 RepID=A0A5B8U7K3_9ACTN|nr:hypothetical protein [Baekduia soli]QEC49064.1 hypothetical protein FSW04_16770 [Baekduia soli]